MSGNKTNNGVHEVGTDETLKAYQDDTPGQQVEKYLSQVKVVNEQRQKKHFSSKYPNPLKGFPYNEEKLEEACWDGYVQKGFKMKNGNQVPNCVPIGEELEEVNEIFGISQDTRYRAKVMKMLDDEGIKYKKDGRNALIILGVKPKDQKKLLNRIHKEFGMSSYSMIDEGKNLEEAKYTNIHNKIKNIKNLKRKESEFIANIDPAVMGQVVKALMPMFEEVDLED